MYTHNNSNNVKHNAKSKENHKECLHLQFAEDAAADAGKSVTCTRAHKRHVALKSRVQCALGEHFPERVALALQLRRHIKVPPGLLREFEHPWHNRCIQTSIITTTTTITTALAWCDCACKRCEESGNLLPCVGERCGLTAHECSDDLHRFGLYTGGHCRWWGRRRALIMQQTLLLLLLLLLTLVNFCCWHLLKLNRLVSSGELQNSSEEGVAPGICGCRCERNNQCCDGSVRDVGRKCGSR